MTQLENGGSLREAHYVGGDGADWVDQFAHCAAADFPVALKPERVYSASGIGSGADLGQRHRRCQTNAFFMNQPVLCPATRRRDTPHGTQW